MQFMKKNWKNRQKNGRRILALGLCFCLSLSLNGCGRDKEDISKGRVYREEKLEIPVKDAADVVSMLKNDKDELEFYAFQPKESSVEAYVTADGENWNTQGADWIALKEEEELLKVIMGQDKTRYALVSGQEKSLRVIKEENGGTEVSLPVLQILEDTGELTVYDCDLQVFADGSAAIRGKNKIYICNPGEESPQNELKLPEENGSRMPAMAVKEDKIATVSEDGGSFLFQQTRGEQKGQSFAYEDAAKEGAIVIGEKNTLFILNEKGISHLQPGGDLTEVLMDGRGTMLEKSGYYAKGAELLENQEFAVLYKEKEQGGENVLCRYSYQKEEAKDNTAKEEKEEEDNKLVIYGLEEESAMVNSAIQKFSAVHPEISVEYQIGSTSGSGAATRSDNIRTLNTELLNGKGPDVLMLEGLPIQSYMEKGVLADISDVLKPYLSDGVLPEAFTKEYTMDGEIYGLTLRYGVPIVVGTPETVEIMKDVEKLADWLEEHPGESWLGDRNTYEETLTALIYANYKKVVKEDRSFEPKALAQCFMVAKEIEDRADPQIIEQRKKWIEEEAGGVLKHCSGNGFQMGRGGFAVVNGEAQAIIADFNCLEWMKSTWRAVRENNLVYDTLGGVYEPYRIAGVNSHTRHPELAEDFIEILLSESVQRRLDLDGHSDGYYRPDGLPCSQEAVEKIISEAPETLEESIEKSGYGEQYYEEGLEKMGCELLRSEAKELFDLARQIDTPVLMDQGILEMILDEAKLYKDGSETADEAAEKLEQKTKTYMQE